MKLRRKPSETALTSDSRSVADSSWFGNAAERVHGFEREVILGELKRSHFHVTNTAKVLGLERSHLYKKAEQLGIDLRSLRNDSAE